MKNFILIILVCLPSFTFAEVLVIDLNQGQVEALIFSKQIQAQSAEYFAALKRINTLRSDNYPQISLDSQYRYVTEVPEMNLPAPINKKISLGQNENYSIGLGVSYLLTDFGQNKNNIAGSAEEAKALEELKNNSEALLRLKISQLYLKLRFQVSQMRALLDSWSLAKDQEKDMAKRFNSGISSRLDYVKATKESSGFKLKLLQFQRDFSETIRDWITLTGKGKDVFDLSKAAPEELSSSWIEKNPSLIRIAPFVSLNEFSDTNENHPQLLQFYHLSLSQKYKSEAVSRSYFPRVQFQARTSYEYPNGAKAQGYKQNAVMVGLTMPIWDGERRSEQKEAFEFSKRAFELQKENLKHEFTSEIQKLKTRLNQLQSEEQVIQDGKKDAEVLAQLTYQSYLNGRSQFLEVQNANLKVLEWKTQMDTVEYARALTYVQLQYFGAK